VNRDLTELVSDLRNAGQWAGQRAARETEKSAERLRDTARSLAPRTRLPHYAEAITHEVTHVGHVVDGEVGPEKGGQGSLGHILEFGTSQSPPHAHLGPALDIEGPAFERAMADVLDPFQ
jgi:HK97 gp10 family phage protein